MIKLILRKNLLYLLVFYISYLIRFILTMIIQKQYNRTFVYIYLYLMVLGEIIGGGLIYLYQNLLNIRKKQKIYFKVNSIKKNNDSLTKENKTKKISLIFFASFFDFFHVIINNLYAPLINTNISKSIDSRLTSVQIISSSLIYTYAFKFMTKKHHKTSLIIISIFLCLTIILDIIFNLNNLHIERFLFVDLLIAFHNICCSLNGCIEKYLVDTNLMNPFLLLLFEGLFEVIISIIFSIGKDPFKNITKEYQENTKGSFTLLIILLFLNFVLSIIANVYKVYCNVVYSPMSRSLIQYLLNPFFNIYYFFSESDFNNSYIYFIISEIICVIISFFGCIYNEYIVLFCCGLESETQEVISLMAKNEIIPLTNIDISEIEDDIISIDNRNTTNLSEKISKDNGIDDFISLGNYTFKI